jgi:hypothetical protein
VQPTREELRQAFEAGFQAIDDGETFYTGFYAFLQACGYRRQVDSPCTCRDAGAHGHMPECRWLKRTAGGPVAAEEEHHSHW